MTRNTLVLLLTALCALGAAGPASADVVISQAYGGGGNSGAPLNRDFVELFNRGSSPVSLDGRSLQYGSASGDLGASVTVLPDVTLAPGQYFLAAQSGGSSGAALPAPDVTGGMAMSASAGKVALASGASPLGCTGASGTRCADRVEDLVGYGATANAFEGSGPAPGLSNTTAALRGEDGCADTQDNAADFVAGAPAPRNTASALAPCEGDAPPAVASTSPADGDDGVAPDATLRVTFSEPVDASAEAFALACAGPGATPAPVDLAVTGGPTEYALDPASALARGASCTLTIRAAGVPGLPADRTVTFTVATVCGDSFTPVHEIQGGGATSPLAGSRVSTEGVVSAVFPGLSGFFVQGAADDDAATSDGVFVYGASGVEAGDRVRVRRTVTEFRRAAGDDGTLTELTSPAVQECGTGAVPRPQRLDLPAARADLERLEGMLVTTTDRLTVTELYNLRFGEALLSAGGPLVQPTEWLRPGPQAAAADVRNTERTILLDDGRSSTNLDPIRFTSAADALRRGDEVRGDVVGALSFDFDAFRIQPVGDVRFRERNPRPASVERLRGDVTAGSFNVLNSFITYGREEDRGAPNAAEAAQQEAKVVATLNRMDAAVVGLQEIQDTSDEPVFGNDADVALARLAGALNEAAGREKWAYVRAPAGFGNTDEIRVAQIHQPARVTPVGPSVAFPDPAFVGIARVPLAQTYRAGRSTFTVVANHFKSKGCGGATGPDADQGDGQSCYNATRVAQSRALLRFVASLQKSSGDDDVLVVGDLNAYTREDPIRALEDGGLVNLHGLLEWPSSRYSYVFNGRHGTLDHALATRSLARQATGSDLWHVNADEAWVAEYGGFDELYAPNPYRSSDHDASVAAFDLTDRRR